MPVLNESRRMSTMPKKIDDELKATAVRLVNDHQGEYSSLTAAGRSWPSSASGASTHDGRASKVSAGSISPSLKPVDSSPPPPSLGRRCAPMTERRAIPVYLSLDEAAEAMSVMVKTIRRWIAAGTLPAYRCGKRAIRIKLEDLEAAPRQIPSARW
jgi:excisionase family DNA binding protein